MIRYFIPFTLLCATLAFASCGDNEDNDIDVPTEEVVPGTNHNVLVAYFSEPLPDGVDASTSASRVIVNGDLYGSVEYMATVISETTGADIVRIQTATPYPGNFDDLASQADNERQNDIHPALATEIENFDDCRHTYLQLRPAHSQLYGCRPVLPCFAAGIGERPDSRGRKPIPYIR